MTTPITDATIQRIEKAHTGLAGSNVTTKYKAAFVALGHEMRALEQRLQASESALSLMRTVAQWTLVHHNEDPESCIEKLKNAVNFNPTEQ